MEPTRINTWKECRHGLMLFNANDRYIGRSLDLYDEFAEDECRGVKRGHH